MYIYICVDTNINTERETKREREREKDCLLLVVVSNKLHCARSSLTRSAVASLLGTSSSSTLHKNILFTNVRPQVRRNHIGSITSCPLSCTGFVIARIKHRFGTHHAVSLSLSLSRSLSLYICLCLCLSLSLSLPASQPHSLSLSRYLYIHI